MKFRIGDICRLNSGGQDFTVVDFVEATKIVTVAWYYAGAEQTTHYPEACIYLVRRPTRH